MIWKKNLLQKLKECIVHHTSARRKGLSIIKVTYLFQNLNIQTDSQTTCMKDEGPDVRAKFE